MCMHVRASVHVHAYIDVVRVVTSVVFVGYLFVIASHFLTSSRPPSLPPSLPLSLPPLPLSFSPSSPPFFYFS